MRNEDIKYWHGEIPHWMPRVFAPNQQQQRPSATGGNNDAAARSSSSSSSETSFCVDEEKLQKLYQFLHEVENTLSSHESIESVLKAHPLLARCLHVVASSPLLMQNHKICSLAVRCLLQFIGTSSNSINNNNNTSGIRRESALLEERSRKWAFGVLHTIIQNSNANHNWKEGQNNAGAINLLAFFGVTNEQIAQQIILQTIESIFFLLKQIESRLVWRSTSQATRLLKNDEHDYLEEIMEDIRSISSFSETCVSIFLGTHFDPAAARITTEEEQQQQRFPQCLMLSLTKDLTERVVALCDLHARLPAPAAAACGVGHTLSPMFVERILENKECFNTLSLDAQAKAISVYTHLLENELLELIDFYLQYPLARVVLSLPPRSRPTSAIDSSLRLLSHCFAAHVHTFLYAYQFIVNLYTESANERMLDLLSDLFWHLSSTLAQRQHEGDQNNNNNNNNNNSSNNIQKSHKRDRTQFEQRDEDHLEQRSFAADSSTIFTYVPPLLRSLLSVLLTEAYTSPSSMRRLVAVLNSSLTAEPTSGALLEDAHILCSSYFKGWTYCAVESLFPPLSTDTARPAVDNNNNNNAHEAACIAFISFVSSKSLLDPNLGLRQLIKDVIALLVGFDEEKKKLPEFLKEHFSQQHWSFVCVILLVWSFRSNQFRTIREVVYFILNDYLSEPATATTGTTTATTTTTTTITTTTTSNEGDSAITTATTTKSDGTAAAAAAADPPNTTNYYCSRVAFILNFLDSFYEYKRRTAAASAATTTTTTAIIADNPSHEHHHHHYRHMKQQQQQQQPSLFSTMTKVYLQVLLKVSHRVSATNVSDLNTRFDGFLARIASDDLLSPEEVDKFIQLKNDKLKQATCSTTTTTTIKSDK